MRVRNEHQCTLEELARITGMSSAHAGLHLRCMKGSEYLLSHAVEYRFPLTLIVELVRCEAQFGDLNARKLVKAAAEGRHTSASLARYRAEVKDGKKATAKKQRQSAISRGAGSILRAYKKDPASHRAELESTIERLRAALAGGAAPEAATARK